MPDSQQSYVVAGHHSGLSLAPPAIHESSSSCEANEEFDFLVSQRRLRGLASIGGKAVIVCAFAIVGLLVWNGRSNATTAGNPDENVAKTPAQLTSAASQQPRALPKQPAEARLAQSSEAVVAPATSPESLARMAHQRGARSSVKGKLGRRAAARPRRK